MKWFLHENEIGRCKNGELVIDIEIFVSTFYYVLYCKIMGSRCKMHEI
jgi:ABC-type anion transport system duplicated permease subunit